MAHTHFSKNGLSKLLRGEMVRALFRTFVARAIVALGAFAFAVVIGRLYGPAGVGVYALAQGLLLGAGLLSRTGMDNALIRYIGQDPSSPFVLRYLHWAVRRSFLISLAGALILWCGRHWFASLFGVPDLAAVLAGIALAVPPYVFSFILSGFFKGVRKPATASLLENGSVALLAGLLLVVWQWVDDSAVSIATIGFAYAIAAWLVALQAFLQLQGWLYQQVWRKKRQWKSKVDAPVSKKQFNGTSNNFFMTNFASFMQQVLGVMVAGWLLSSADLGLFKAAQQTSVLIGFILIVINAILPPKFSSLYYQGKITELGSLARRGALLGLIFSLPFLIVCILFPRWILSWFGGDFGDAENLLRLLAVAQALNVSSGSVIFLLGMTGHEKLVRNLSLLCNGLGLVAFFILIPPFGPLGAAFALTFILVAQNLLALFYVWRRLGIWILPSPNFLAMAGVEGGR